MHGAGWWGGGWWWIWWVIWILIIVWAFTLWAPRRHVRRPTPLEVLQHRLARGEISQEDYERLRALLERDQPPPRRHG